MVPAGLGFGTHQSKLLFEVALPNREVAGGVVKNYTVPHTHGRLDARFSY